MEAMMGRVSGTTTWRDSKGLIHEGGVAQSAGGFDVIDCGICDFKHVIPVPTPDELAKIYSHDYYSVEKPLYIERYLEDKEWWDAVYQERYEILERHLESHRRKILDVGSGPGLFLLKGRERGWRVKGIEPSRQAAAFSRDILGLDVEELFLDKGSAGNLGRFDAVNMGEVLEHLPDPAGMLELARGLLNDGGLICIIVPNDFNPFQIVLRDHLGFKPWWVAPPHHLNYFDSDSLKRLMERCGFEVIHQEATFPIDIFLLMGENYVGNDALGRECHARRKAFESALRNSGRGDLIRRVYRGLAEMGLGRELVLFARKR